MSWKKTDPERLKDEQAIREVVAARATAWNAGDTVEAIGAPKAVRAVANSCSRCWHAFAVPCHRVLHGAAATTARRDPRHARRYRWVDYEAGFAPARLPE